ncbi:MAG: hypothetical protein Q9227_001404 [Pyrenula ochraceoflavens]
MANRFADCLYELTLVPLRYVDYALKQVRMLLHFGVQPYLVFDGDHLPGKAETERERYERRQESKLRGLGLYHAGRISQAHQELQKAVDVTPQMARDFIDELKRLKIPYIVAPYEADAQLTYLEKKGIIDGIISEDSDLLVFGAKRLLTKLDQYGGCVEINRIDFGACRDISLIGWTDADFRCMAILSGCDYLPSINKVGLKTAYRYVRKYKNVEKILRMFSFDGQFCVPPDYLEKFKRAEIAFKHHRVFCPVAKKLVFLNDLSAGMTDADLSFLGEDVAEDIAVGVASGELHPMTKQPLISGPTKFSRGLEPRRVTMGSTRDLKGQRPLDGWMKPKRVPLADLDPNSLSYSPSQIRMIEENTNVSWEPRVMSSAPAMRRSASALPDNLRSPIPRSSREEFLSRAAKISTSMPTPNSSKRQRLCTDTTSGSSPAAVKVSPFFGKDETSPTMRKKMRAKSRKPSDFNIFSDDSVEEAMMELRDLDDAGKTPKIQVFTDKIPVSSSAEDNATASEAKLEGEKKEDASTETSIRNRKRAQTDTEKVELGRAALTVKIQAPNSPPKFQLQNSSSKMGKLQLQSFSLNNVSDTSAQANPAMSDETCACNPDAEGYVSDSPVSRRQPQSFGIVSGGSEDFLVPNSEDEIEDLSEGDRSAKIPAFNLGKFKFTPNE